MSIARRIGVALAIAGSVVASASASAQRASPGYTYRLRMYGRVTEPSGRAKDYIVMYGHAMVSEKGGRLDVDEASRQRGAVTDNGTYILYDPTSMTIVSPKSRQIAKLTLATLEQELSGANMPDMRATISDVAVSSEKLGPGEPMFGMATTKYRITQDYKVAAKTASAKRNSTEHVVRDVWVADEQKGLANPFARLALSRAGSDSGFGELLTRTAEAQSRMGRGIPLKTMTATTSTSSRSEVTETMSVMDVTELQAENIDDDVLVAPTDYQVVAVSELARAAPNSPGAQTGAPAKVARPAATGDAAADAKQGFVKTLHGMGRRP
ncbi:MAG TPA: hypothetical protein VF461_08895 [Gemmatimonadaceae bacterium]